jgi:hypothetical protein
LPSEQFALFVAPDKGLEHGAAIEVDELQRAGMAAEERPIDKLCRRASGNAQMSAKRAMTMDVEIAPGLAPWRQ